MDNGFARHHITVPVTLLWLLAGPWACSNQTVQCVDDTKTAAEALVNAASQASYLGLEPWEANAVVRLSVESGEAPDPVTCTGLLVETRHVLSAAHCFPQAQTGRIRVAFGSNSAWSTDGAVSARHETLDLALVELVGDPQEGIDVGTIPPILSWPAGTRKGTLVQIAGYGIDDAGKVGTREFAVETVRTVTSDAIVISADGYSGACLGDSGGPMLVRGAAGAVFVIGVLKEGSASCVGEDEYTRVDSVKDWLFGQLGNIQRTEPRNGSYNTLGSEGRCFDQRPVWTSAGKLHEEACTSGTSCGWDSNARGFRCVGSDKDACRGVADVGDCVDDRMRRCVRGALVESDCGACGWDCVRSPQTGDAVCGSP